MTTAFNNIPARTREQREKDRLRQRKEGFVRIDTSATGAAMLVYTPQAQGFLSDADRSHSDTVGEAREERQARVKIHRERKRYDNVQREIQRWKDMDAASAEEEARWRALRESGSKARRNKGDEAFNPITLQYNDGKDGQRLMAADQAVKHRAVVRAQNLQHHNSRAGINPITGEPVRQIAIHDLLPPSSQ
ncbi:hypothetical protein FI667_g406, partial [Globisporangium splendens]